MKRLRNILGFLCLALWAGRFPSALLAAEDPNGGFQLTGEKWTYSSPGRTFAGYLLKPEGQGPFPAVIINHGKGGRPEQFSLNWAREMVQWGLVCICPTLTHVAGTDIQGKDGASEENIARDATCLGILEQLGCVDMKRVAVTGHSMGSFLTIGYCGTAGGKIKAAAISAGGLGPRPGLASPPRELAANITAPFLILHGNVDQAVPHQASAALQEVLEKNKVPNRRVIFENTDHSLPTNPATRATVLTLIHEWFTSQGVLDPRGDAAPMATPPADQLAKAGEPAGPYKFSVGDADAKPTELAVTVASSNSKLLPAASLKLAGQGAERSVEALPVPGQAGTTTIFLTVSDHMRTTTRSFVLRVADANGVVPTPTIERRLPPGPPLTTNPPH